MQRVENIAPVLVAEEELGNVAAHDGQVDVRRADTRRVTHDPGDRLARRALPRLVEHPPGGIDTDHAVALRGKRTRDQTGSAPEIENRRGSDFGGERRIEARLRAFRVRIHRVVHGDQPRVRELGDDRRRFTLTRPPAFRACRGITWRAVIRSVPRFAFDDCATASDGLASMAERLSDPQMQSLVTMFGPIKDPIGTAATDHCCVTASSGK